MDCLNCRTEMTTYDVVTKQGRITYNACDRCGSLWLDRGELDKMAFQVDGSIDFSEEGERPEPEAQPKKCPRCEDSPLTKVKFLGCDDITLHFCTNCQGFWLNGGELNLVNSELAKIMPVKGHGFSDFVNNVHVPYWYKRTQRKSRDTDFIIDSLVGASLGGATTDRCPSCGATLNVYRLHLHDFEGCPTCKGVWLAQDDLRKLKNKEADGSLRWLNDEIENLDKCSVRASDRLCVHCKTARMVCVVFGHSSVTIDWCPACHGVWLDRGEFDAITNYLKDELDTMQPRDIAAHAASDLARAVKGAPEGRVAELADAKTALSAFLNASIFERPALFNWIMSSGLPR